MLQGMAAQQYMFGQYVKLTAVEVPELDIGSNKALYGHGQLARG